MFVTQNGENVWAEMKVVKHRQNYHFKTIYFLYAGSRFEMKTNFFLCFLKDSYFLKYKPALALASGYDRSKKKKKYLKKE